MIRVRVPSAWLLFSGWLVIPGAATPATAQDVGAPEVVYRSEPLERTSGPPDVYRATVSPCDPAGRFRLVLDNGAAEGRRVSSASVHLNGTAVVQERDLGQQVGQIARPVTLAATNTLEVRLAGGPGGRVRVSVDGYMSCLRVRITAPAPGATLREPAVLVEGEVESRSPAGVRVHATLPLPGGALDWPVPTEVNGGRFAARVDLAPGPVRLVAVASTADGREARDAVTVTFEPDPPDYLRAIPPGVSPTVGFAPLTVSFTAPEAASPDVDVVDLDVDGDGRPDFSLPDFAAPPHQLTYTYAREGLHVATLVVRDKTSGVAVTSRVPINVIPRPDLAALWSAFRAALARGDRQAALAHVASEDRGRYQRVLDDLGPDLPAVAAALGDATPLVVTPSYATASALRRHDGASEAFLIHFVRDGDGVWRIASM
jgi:hypothetical protein